MKVSFTRSRFTPFLIATLLLTALSFCKTLPGDTPQPTVIVPSDQNAGSETRPSATETNFPTQPTKTATNMPRPPQATSIPVLDLHDNVSVLSWILRGIQKQDSSFFKDLIGDGRLIYANYIEGGQTVDTTRFLADLEKRFPGRPRCLGITEGNEGLQLWTTGWSPDWQMEEICNTECSPLKPPWKSSTAGFLFFQHDGLWKLDAVYLNTPENYLFTPNFSFYRCEPPYTELANQTPEP